MTKSDYENLLPDQEKVVTVRDKAGTWVGQATFWKRRGRWFMIGRTHRLKFMDELSPDELKPFILGNKMSYQWTERKVKYPKPGFTKPESTTKKKARNKKKRPRASPGP